ncbi:(R)-citramalate synthase CimA [uncultured archaeon]|nr:(R)-citramalate synthase CimA [uncultured archaeon]
MILPFNSSTASSFVEIMDTTLRDGEQTEEVSFSSSEKLALAKKLLLEVKVDRIEIASARVSKGEEESCKEIFVWAKEAGLLDKVEVLGFVDYNKSVDWVSSLGGKVINLLCKGSKNHCLNQLHKTPQEHFFDIKKTAEYARSKGFIVNAYLEDFSNGIKEDEKYVFDLAEILFSNGVKRAMLADTLGVLSPEETLKFVPKIISAFPNMRFDFHGHNDYGLAVANSLAAIKAGCAGVHVTVNGLGERAGNTPLEAIVPVINDFTEKKCRADEKKLVAISHLVELFSKRRIEKNHPIVGQVVFTQTAGIHADGDKKGGLYKSKLSADRFTRTTKYALGKLSGKASIEISLKQLGITLSKDDLAKVLQKVIELGDKKQFVSKEDLFFIVNELSANGFVQKFKVLDYKIASSAHKKPRASVKILLNGKNYSAVALGDGGYNAFINALKKIFAKKKLSFPQLIDYEVRIPVGGRTDALVETKTVWKRGNRKIETIGVSTDQVEAAIKATEKMINVALMIGERD